MARSIHTRPKAIIAAERLRDPRGRRDATPSRRSGEAASVGQSPRITVQKARSRFHHPATRAQIRHLLEDVGALAFYGVEHIELRQREISRSKRGICFGRLSIPGKIILYEQPDPPWFLPGRLPSALRLQLEQAGALISISTDGSRCQIDWPGDTLTNFMLFDVLLHEIGHHIIQQFTGKRLAQVMRRRDHELTAQVFASNYSKRLAGAVGSSLPAEQE